MARETTTVSLDKEILVLIKPFLTIHDPLLGIDAKITMTALVEAIIQKWHQEQLDKDVKTE